MILLFSLLILYPWEAQAQFRRNARSSKVPERGWVILLGAGAAAVRSDICGSWGCNDIGPSVSVGGLYKFTPYLGASGTIDYIKLGASDKERNSPLNIAFESEVIEVSGSVVLNLLDSYAGSGNYRSKRKRFIVPYGRVGVGMIYYTPTSFPRDRSLDDSQTTYDPEREYPAIAAVIPIGGGLRFHVNDEISIATEVVYRATSTDFLDNVGPRLGNSTTKDQYGVVAVKLMYTPVLKNKIFSKKP